MNNFCTVADCGRPAQEMLCTGCLTELVTALRELAYGPRDSKGNATPGLIEELQTTRHRLSVSGKGDGRGTSETPLPFHEEASTLAWTVENTIGTWVREFEESNDHLDPFAGSTVTEAAQWLAKWPGLLAMHPAADELHDEFVWLVREIRRTIDRAPDLVLLGRCGAVFDGIECEDTLKGAKDSAYVRCRTCGTEHDAHARWREAQERVRDVWATAAEISNWIAPMYGKAVKANTISQWFKRGALEAIDGRYRVGDVLDMAERGVLRKVS